MLRRLSFLVMLLATLAVLPGCIVHDTGYYPYDRAYYYGPYYPYYYYEPYPVAPFWFSGNFIISDSNRGHYFYGHRGDGFGGRRGFEGRGGSRR